MATSKINADFLFKTHDFNIPAQASGAAGTRACITDEDITIQGYIPVSATIATALVGMTERVDIMLFRDSNTGADKLRCTVYHTYQAATTALSFPVRILYIKSGS